VELICNQSRIEVQRINPDEIPKGKLLEIVCPILDETINRGIAVIGGTVLNAAKKEQVATVISCKRFSI
jgi:hypothetical protein